MSYDNWKTTAPEDDGREPPTPCCVCTGDMTAEPCGEDCAKLVAKCARRTRITGLYLAIHRAMCWARAYYLPHRPPDPRTLACLDQVRFYRRQIRELRAA